MAVSVETKPWTVEDLYRIPRDENRYEVLCGELLVTPPPGDKHEVALARLNSLLVPYVVANRLGLVFSGNPAIHREGSFLIPDLLVRRPFEAEGATWAEQTLPILVVEVRSPSTWNRDRTSKRSFYLRLNVPDYWMVDPERELVVVVRPGEPDREVRDVFHWRPDGAAEPLEIQIRQIFHRD